MSRLLDALHSGRVLLMDGAMGTELQRAGMPDGACYEEWNLTHSDKVLAIHQAYVDAGAEVVLTNTFQAYYAVLQKHRLEFATQSILKEGVRLACRAGKQYGLVFCSIGPSDRHRPLDVKSLLAINHEFDGFLIETASDGSGAGVVPWPLQGLERIPILWSFAFYRDASRALKTVVGWTPHQCAVYANVHGAVALGVNCGREIGLNDVVEILQQYRANTDLPLFARPNAGTPTKIDGHWHYPVTPEQMAAAVPAMIEAGATMIGGCCGTTPAHIAAMKKAVDAWNESR